MKNNINLNSIIYFELSEHGLDLWRKDKVTLNQLLGRPAGEGTDSPPSSMQIWEFMALFGPSMHTGANMPIVGGFSLRPPSALEKLASAGE